MSVAPLQFLLVVFAGWVNRRQCDIVAYLKKESRFLREQIGDRRLRFTDALGRNTIKRILAEHGFRVSRSARRERPFCGWTLSARSAAAVRLTA